MEVASVECNLETVFLELLDRPVEKVLVIGLEMKLSAGYKKLFVSCKETGSGKATLVLSLLRPGVGEVRVYAIKSVRRKPIGKIFRVSDNESHVVGTLVCCSLGFFEREHGNIGYSLERNNSVVGMHFAESAGKVTLAASDLEEHGDFLSEYLVFFSEAFYRIFKQKFGACFNSFRRMLLFSHSHLEISLKICYNIVWVCPKVPKRPDIAILYHKYLNFSPLFLQKRIFFSNSRKLFENPETNMKKEEFLKLLQARLVERGVPEETAKKETEHVRTYLTESGMENLDIEVDEMADGIIAMLDDSAEKVEDISVPVAVPAETETESVSDELSAAIAAMDAETSDQSEKSDDLSEDSEHLVHTDNDIYSIPIVIEVADEQGNIVESAPIEIENTVNEDSVPAEDPVPVEQLIPEDTQVPETLVETPTETDAESHTEETEEERPVITERVDPPKPTEETKGETVPSQNTDIDEEDADIEEFIPYDKKLKMRKNEKAKNNDNAWLYVTLLVITIPIAIALILIAFALYLGFWVILALAMIACVAALIVFVTVGAIVALVGIVYGVVQLITGYVPVGLFEVGLGIIVGAVVMFVGILVYNFAVRFIPFGMKLLAKLFRAGFRGIRSGYQSLKGAVASL